MAPRRTATTANGAVPEEDRGRFLAHDPRPKPRRPVAPKTDRQPRALVLDRDDPGDSGDDPDPTSRAMAASNPAEGASSELDTLPLEGFTGAVSGAVGRPEMLPQEIEAIGPNGEVITLKRDERGQFVTVNTNVPPPPIGAEVDHPILQQLRSRTSKPKGQVQRAPAYNHRMLWYMKPDGEIVPLQGDPGNRAYYEDKGFVVLRPNEEQVFLRGDSGRAIPPIRRVVIAEQRRRAVLITTIRNIASRNPSVELVGDLSITPTDELEALLTDLRGAQGINFRLLEARQRTAPDYDERDDKVLEGLEAGSAHDLYRKMARSREQQRIGGINRSPSQGAVDLTQDGVLTPH
jgi:hypothetical protein